MKLQGNLKYQGSSSNIVGTIFVDACCTIISININKYSKVNCTLLYLFICMVMLLGVSRTDEEQYNRKNLRITRVVLILTSRPRVFSTCGNYL